MLPRLVPALAQCALWLGCLGLGAAHAQAQRDVPAATGAGTSFAISGFSLQGDVPLSGAETARILAPFIGPHATLATLQQASAALESAFKERGFLLHRVSLPAQELGGPVTLDVVRFVIGKVSVSATVQHTPENIRASIPELREGGTPNFRLLAVQTTLANENPSKQLQVTVKESEDEPDKIDANVQVKEASPWNGSVSMNNSGTDATGNDRFTVSLGYANAWSLDHQVSLAYTTSLEKPDQVSQTGFNYRIPLYSAGAVLGLSYTSSSVVGNFGGFSSTGAGQTYGLSYNDYGVPVTGFRSFWTYGLDYKVFNASQVNGSTIAGQVDRSSNPVSLGYNARHESDTVVWSLNADVEANIPGSPGNDSASYQSEDARISNVAFSVLHGGATLMKPLVKGWYFNLASHWQYTGDALISGEQFGLGGQSSVRGAAERAIAGDTGATLSLELHSADLHPGLHALAFVDSGWLGSNNTDASTSGMMASNQLQGLGLGLRYVRPGWNVLLDWGHLVLGANQPPGGNTSLPRAGDERTNLSVTASF